MPDIRLQHRRRLFSTISRNPQRVVFRSPVAIGIVVERVISRSASTFSGWVGSSTNIGLYGSSSFNRILAMAGLTARWKSMATSISGPTASRIAAILATMASVIAGVSM